MESITPSYSWFSIGEIVDLNEGNNLFLRIKLLNDEVFLFECPGDYLRKFKFLKKGCTICFWFEDERSGKRKIKDIELKFS